MVLPSNCDCRRKPLHYDATEFFNYQQIYYDGGDDDNKDANILYAGPMCASSGQKIKIGVFTDDKCMFLDDSKDVENLLINKKHMETMLYYCYDIMKIIYL